VIARVCIDNFFSVLCRNGSSGDSCHCSGVSLLVTGRVTHDVTIMKKRKAEKKSESDAENGRCRISDSSHNGVAGVLDVSLAENEVICITLVV